MMTENETATMMLALARRRSAVVRLGVPWALLLAFSYGVFPAATFAQAGADEAPESHVPAGGVDAAESRTDRLIEQLGDARPAVREMAHERLARMGFAAFDALSAAENHDDVEIAMRARQLIRGIRIAWHDDDDPIEVRRILQRYSGERRSDQYRVQDDIRDLAILPDHKGVVALCRIARYEKSHVISKEAALAVVRWHRDVSDERWDTYARSILAAVGPSRRPATIWLRTYASYRKQPNETLTRWSEHADAEYECMTRFPDRTRRSIVRALYRHVAERYVEQHRRDEAIAHMHKLVRLETGRTESLIPLITWLTRWEAWEVIDEIESRFQRQVDRDAVLIYTLAQARDAQGNTEESERLAAKALEIDAEDARRHIMIALRLQETGMLRWAEREYRHVIKIGPADSEEALTAGTWLAELLHDQLRDAAAAKLLDDVVELARTSPRAAKYIERMAGRSGINVRARMHYFFALAEREAGNLAAHVARLDKAIAVDPSDGDVLIALYRLPRQSDQRRADTRTLIVAAEKRLDAEVLDADSEIRRARSLNQYAWLIGNTEGDIDKAIRYSQESLAIRPQQAGYLDTLAHCYAGKGDYESAVRYQSQAAELEPHSGLISRKLKVFQDELARRQQRRLLLPPEP